MNLDYKLVAQKFLKGALFGAGSALFSVDLSLFALNDVESYKKLGLVVTIAFAAGFLHGLWNVGKQIYLGLNV